jgi:hypothetical protein
MITSLFVAMSLAFVAGAVAFRSSDVKSGAGATVTTTSTAALSVEVVDSSIASYVNSALRLNFLNQQPDSSYTYNSAFRVTNRTAQSRAVSVGAVGGEATPGVHFTISTTTPAATLWQNGGSGGASLIFTANQAVDFNVMVTVDQGATLSGANPMSITLNGQ